MNKIRTKHIYLVRHGKVLGEAALNGRTDVLVDSSVQDKICTAIASLPFKLDAVVTSPLSRCHDLAERVAQTKSLNLESINELQEMNFGDVDGVPFDLLSEQWESLESFWQDPANHQLTGAESLQAFHQRVIQGWSQLISSTNDNILLVTHGGVIRMILAHCLDIDWKKPTLYSNLAIGNASLTHIQITQTDNNYISVKVIGQPLLAT
ncbi:alpha-ribazole phosphatase family protein [Vibrio fortis]|uniref:alpha-ribazole phosphatase family protein n=1 Tax=Vibrio fortis TaxID=212667 RepID=UPI003EBCFC2A